MSCVAIAASDSTGGLGIFSAKVRNAAAGIALVASAAAGLLVGAGLGAFVVGFIGLLLLVGASLVLAIHRPTAWLAIYVMAMLTSPDPHFPLGAVTVAFHLGDVLFAGALGALVLSSGRRRTIPAPIATAILWPLLTVPAAFALSGSSTGAASLFRALRFAESLFPLVFAVNTVTNPERAIDSLTKSFTVAAAISSLYGIVQFYLGFDLGFLGIHYANHYLFTDAGTRLRAVGIFYEASGYGTMSAMLLWFALMQLVAPIPKSMWYRALLVAALPLGAAGLLLSFARAPLLALIGATAIAALVQSRGISIKRSALTGITLAVALGLILVAVPGLSTLVIGFRIDPILANTSFDSALLSSGRTLNWGILLGNFAQFPPLYWVIGLGYKSLMFSPVEATDFTTAVAGDSQFITTLIEQGVVGLAVVIVLVVFLARAFALRRHARSAIGAYSAIFLSYWLAEVLFQFPIVDYLTYFRLMPVLTAAAGIFMCSTTRSRPGTTVEMGTGPIGVDMRPEWPVPNPPGTTPV